MDTTPAPSDCVLNSLGEFGHDGSCDILTRDLIGISLMTISLLMFFVGVLILLAFHKSKVLKDKDMPLFVLSIWSIVYSEGTFLVLVYYGFCITFKVMFSNFFTKI